MHLSFIKIFFNIEPNLNYGVRDAFFILQEVEFRGEYMDMVTWAPLLGAGGLSAQNLLMCCNRDETKPGVHHSALSK